MTTTDTPTPDEVERAKRIMDEIAAGSIIRPGLEAFVMAIVRQAIPVIERDVIERCIKIVDEEGCCEQHAKTTIDRIRKLSPDATP